MGGSVRQGTSMGGFVRQGTSMGGLSKLGLSKMSGTSSMHSNMLKSSMFEGVGGDAH